MPSVRPGLARAPAVVDRGRPRRSAARSATLVACFLVGVAVAEAALAKALGQDSTAQRGGRAPSPRLRQRRPAVLRRAPALRDPRGRRDSHGLVVGARTRTIRHVRGHESWSSAALARRFAAALASLSGRASSRLDLCAPGAAWRRASSVSAWARRTEAPSTLRARRERRSTRAGARSRSAASTSSAASGCGRLGDSRFLRCDARHARDVALRAGGRAFDVVLANPPFVAGGSSRFAAGGDDGSSRGLEPLVRTMAAHVGRGGYACVVSEFYASSERPRLSHVPPCPGLGQPTALAA